MLLETKSTSSPKWERICEGTLRLLPLIIVIVCAVAVVLAFTLPGVPPVVRWSALGGGLAVVVIAALRQSLLLGEREKLIETERELRRAEETFRVLVEQASDGIFIAALDGHYMDVNPSGAEMLGMQRSEVIGKHIADVVAPEENPRIEIELGQVKRGEMVRSTWTFQRKDGSTFQGEVTAKLLSDGRVQGIVRDVSERLALEAQLRQSQKMEAMGVLAAGIAHDFNNLLTAIRGNAALAAEDTGSAHPAAESLADLSRAAERATDLVHRILSFSRPTPTTPGAVRLSDLVEEVLKLLRSSLPARIELAQSLPPVSPEVEGDASQIHQVLMNLCTNAGQAIGESAGRIEISLGTRKIHSGEVELDLPAGAYACLSVTDSGQGMSSSVQERIFEPFFTTKSPGEGTGLGLSVVHGIVRAHRGALRVKSKPEHGSTFTVYLPLAEARAAEQNEEERAASPARHTPLRVAYVDDEVQVSRVMVRLLERCGFVVTSYGSGASLLAELAAKACEYDVIVTDFNMPRMSGIELARAISEHGCNVGIVLTSGYMSEQLRAAAEEVGIVRLVKKPESIETLASAIEDAARRPRSFNR